MTWQRDRVTRVVTFMSGTSIALGTRGALFHYRPVWGRPGHGNRPHDGWYALPDFAQRCFMPKYYGTPIGLSTRFPRFSGRLRGFWGLKRRDPVAERLDLFRKTLKDVARTLDEVTQLLEGLHRV